MPSILGVASETWSSVTSPIQRVAVHAYQQSSALEELIARKRFVLSYFGKKACNYLQTHGALVAEPAGGFYLFPDFEPWRAKLATRKIYRSSELCTALLEEANVAVLPGVAFGMPERSLTARIAYVNFDGAATLESEANLDELFAPIKEGLSALINWLNQ